MHRATELFSAGEGSITIPDRWETYVAPLHCPSIYAHVSPSSCEPEERIRCCSMAYVTGLPADAVFLGPSRLLYSASCLEPPAQLYAGEVHWEQPQQHDGSHLVVHGFAGYFTCHLFGGIKLDTRHESPERNVYHWESMFFPLSFPLDPDGICFGVRLERRSGFKSLSLHGDSRRIRGVGEFVPLVSLSEPDLASRRTELYAQWYEWQLLLPDCRNRSLEAHCLVHNRDGNCQSLYL